MWRRRLIATAVLAPRRCQSVSSLSKAVGAGQPSVLPLKLYVLAGEASGDAIGAKVIRALGRQKLSTELLFRGVGGPQMCAAGDFSSLFPMQELSVMGLVEVLPSIWRFRRRIQDTLHDIEAFQPDLVLTIDSKGFTFRVLKALQAKEIRQGNGVGAKRVKKAHYVAPSVWAYKHRGKHRDFTQLEQLLDAMFVILPFEEEIFLASSANVPPEKKWCHFVGHPAVEDFLELHGLYNDAQDREIPLETPQSTSTSPPDLDVGPDSLLDASKYDLKALALRGKKLQSLTENAQYSGASARVREDLGLSTNAFTICALVGSRANEVDKSARLVLDAIERFQESTPNRKICIVFPTISAVEELVKKLVSSSNVSVECRVLSDLDASTRLDLFQSCDLAVAVSGTIVLETTLANLPTVVIYRANRLTEWIAQRLAAVRFVSVPNLLLGRPLLPELLFRECSSPKIADALQELERHPRSEDEGLQLAMATSTLTKWEMPGDSRLCGREETGKEVKPARTAHRPIRASDLVAKHLLKLLGEK